jgi:uncharacterized protein (DUF885 family)
MVRTRAWVAAGLCSLVLGGGTIAAADDRPQDLAATAAAAAAFENVVQEHQRWRDLAYPESAIARGRPTQADRITEPGSRGALLRHNDITHLLERAEAVDASALPEADRLDYALFLRELRQDAAGFAFKRWMMPVGQRGGPQQDLPQFAEGVPFRTPDDWENYVKRLTRLPSAVRDTQAMMVEGLEAKLVPPAAVLEGTTTQFELVLAGKLEPMLAPLSAMPESIPAARQAELRALAENARLDALLALGEMLLWMQSDYIPAAPQSVSVRDQPMGAAFYEFELRRFTTTAKTAQEVHEIGLREVARIRSEMLEVIARTSWQAADGARAALPPDERLAQFISYLRSDPRFYHRSAEALLDGYRAICKRIDAKLPEYFGVLPRLPYGVREIPRFMAPSQTTAYYQPGSMETGMPGWFYANTYALDQRPIYEMIPLSLHEAVPGHHLQIALAREMVGLREFRRDIDATAFTEGWALYAERLGIPMGLFADPYDDFGRLLYEMWRACRLVVDTGIHAQGMPRADAIRFMASNTALSMLNIEREVDRYIAWPGQACAYKIGELEIRRIRSECERRLGTAFDLRAFHDHLLGAGPLPLDVLAARMNAWCEVRSAKEGIAAPLGTNGG